MRLYSENKIEFTCAKLPEKRTIKVVIKGILTDINWRI